MPARVATALRSILLASEHFRQAGRTSLGLGLSESQVLSHLARFGDQGPGELAVRLNLTPGSMTNLLDRLVAADLVTRAPHPTDRRRQVISMTDHSRALVARGDAWFEEMLATLSEEDLQRTAAVLERIAEQLDAKAMELEQEPAQQVFSPGPAGEA